MRVAKLKTNVLHLISSFHQGGSERQAVQLVRLLRGSGCCHVHLACLHRDGVLLSEVDNLGLVDIPEYRLTSFYNFNAIKRLRECVGFLREREIDIVHTHDFYTNIFGMTAAALARVPVRIASRRGTTGIYSAAQSFIERGAYSLAHAIVANAEAVREQLIKEGVPDDKIVTVYNGVDTRRLAPSAQLSRDESLALFNLPRREGHRFVTIVANLRHPVKDYPTFLHAAKRTLAAVPHAAFVIAGEGELTEKMLALASELGLEGATFFIGRCERLAELLAISDVCVLSSKAEGFSNAILEYMAAGRPVVATNVGGAREAIREGATGFLVSAQDHEGMAERIIELLNNPQRAYAMGKLGRRVVAEQFSCRVQLEQTEKLYERLLAPGKDQFSRHVRRPRPESF